MRFIYTARNTQFELSQGLKWSLSIHFGIAFLVLFKSLVFPGKALNYIPTLQVDLVALPDFLKKDRVKVGKSEADPPIAEILKEPSEPRKSSKELAHKDEMVVKPELHKPDSPTKKLEQNNKRALDRLKSLSRIQDSAQEPSKDRSDRLAQSLAIIKGNKLSPGHSLSGDAKEAPEAKYYDILRDHLNENFSLPPWLSRQNYAAQVRLFVDARGKLHSLKFLKFSGNPQFDDAVKRAIRDSEPFPVPPKELVSAFLSDGILFGFPL